MYEYCCELAPKVYLIDNDSEETAAALDIASIMNNKAKDGWEFYSMEEIRTRTKDGCLASLLPGLESSEVVHNLLVFRRKKNMESGR